MHFAMRRLLLGVVVVALAACLPKPSPYQGAGPKVALAGDSQMYLVEHDFLGDQQYHLTDAVMAAGYQASVSSMIGAGSPDLKHLVWPSAPNITVTVIGANDLHSGVPLSTLETNVYWYWAITGAACNVAAEVPETTPWGLDVSGPPYNAWLRSHATVTVPWASTVATHPEYLGSSGVHQTLTGKAAFRAALVDGIVACPS
jgi:hypothetical protein